MKIINTILKVILSIILIIPILGTLGIFPEPTADMYNNMQGYEFIKILMDSKYVMIMMSAVFLISLICLWTKRVALASLLLLPVSLNIVGFHAFLDGGLLTSGAVMGNVLLLLNLYFLWKSCDQISPLLKAKA
jgi:hypothetical protein